MLLSACAPNAAYRTESLAQRCPPQGCDKAVLERHPDYDLGFVEFTDRGNVFDRNNLDTLLNYVQRQAAQPDGAAVIVFVHGWHHNAAPDDRNLKSFRTMLQQAAAHHVTDQRRLIGIYVGWRGQTLDIPGLEAVTFWARKNTAHEVGNGGLTEVLLRLEYLLSPDQTNNPAKDVNKNVFVTLGHSFGGTVLLSALNDVLLDRVVNAQKVGDCYQTRPFGHGVILLNPAVEANEILPLREAVAQKGCFADNQQKLLHVLSSDADIATRIAFKAGQYLGVSLIQGEVPLKRQYGRRTITLHERDLDTITIGNYLPFRTGRSILHTPGIRDPRCSPDDVERDECYINYQDNGEQHLKNQLAQHIPTQPHEPLHFLYTDRNFMANHNDVFNPDVAGYIVAVVKEAGYKRALMNGAATAASMKAKDKVCFGDKGNFSFPHCFDYYKGQFEGKR
jgi:hypothetical protein